MGRLYQNTVYETVMLEYSRWDSYRIQQFGQLQDGMVTIKHSRQDSYNVGQLHQKQQMRELCQNTADGAVTIEHSRQGSYYRTQQMGQLQQNTADDFRILQRVTEQMMLEYSRQLQSR